MTRDETTVIMAAISAAYPRLYASQEDADIDAAISLWTEMFADDAPEVVAAAVKSFIANDEKGFPPVIGQIKAHVVKIIGGTEKSELEAWGEVKKALSNSGYHAAEEFAKLDPVIQRIVGSPSQLREWAMADIDVVDSVIASNFQRSYRASAKQHREYLALPSQVKDFIKAASESMAFEKAINQPEPKALPISVTAVINQSKAAISGVGHPQHVAPKSLTPEQFEARKAGILAGLKADKTQEEKQSGQ